MPFRFLQNEAMSKNYGPKTIDISVTEFDGIPRHEPVEPYEENVIAYRASGREGSLPYTDDVAGMLMACNALEGLREDEEAGLYLTDYVAACAWATSWEHMRRRTAVARSPRYLPQLGSIAAEVRPGTQRMLELGVHTLREATRPFTQLLTAAADDTLTTRFLLAAESDASRQVSSMCGEGALTLACAETAGRLKEKPEMKAQEVQEHLKATAVELTPNTRAIANETGTLPEFRALAESDSDISRFLRINRDVPLIVRRSVASSREAVRDQFPQLT